MLYIFLCIDVLCLIRCFTSNFASVLLTWFPCTNELVCANNIVAEFYQPVKRCDQASILVDEKLYLWAGDQTDIPFVHSSEDKLQATSYVDLFHCKLGMWVRCALCVGGKRSTVHVRRNVLWCMPTMHGGSHLSDENEWQMHSWIFSAHSSDLVDES